MSGNLHPVRTKDQLTAEFAPTIPPITGEINLRELIRVWEHLKSCAQATETNYDAHYYLYVVCPPELWPYFSTRVSSVLPQDPGTNPSCNLGGVGAQNTTICDIWQLNNKYYGEHKHKN